MTARATRSRRRASSARAEAGGAGAPGRRRGPCRRRAIEIGNMTRTHGGTGSLLRDPEFRRLWTAGVVQFLVRWLEVLVFGVYTYQETGSAFLVAGMTMLRLLPLALLGVPFGALAARIRRRTGLIVTMSVLAATAGDPDGGRGRRPSRRLAHRRRQLRQRHHLGRGQSPAPGLDRRRRRAAAHGCRHGARRRREQCQPAGRARPRRPAACRGGHGSGVRAGHRAVPRRA